MEDALRGVVTWLLLGYIFNLLVMLVGRVKKPSWGWYIPAYPVLAFVYYAGLFVVCGILGALAGVALVLAIFVKCIVCLPELWKMEVPQQECRRHVPLPRRWES